MSELAIRNDTSTTAMALAKAMYESGYFPEVKSAAQALVKIYFGQEIGLGPATSMKAIWISKDGSPTAHADVLAAAIRRSKRYDFRVMALTDEACTLVFYELREGQWAEVGTSRFTIDDAKKAGLTGKDVWQKYPRNLLFARALSNGKRWYCSDVAMGFYTPEELGGDGAPIADVEAPDLPAPVVTVMDPGPVTHWSKDPATLRKFWSWAHSTMSLSDDEVHEALCVDHLADFAGSKQDAVAQINTWIEAQIPAAADVTEGAYDAHAD